MLVSRRQRLESQDPELRFEHSTPDEVPRAWEAIEMHKRQILQAALEGDWRFLREVSDATKLLKTGKALRPFFDVDYALWAWRQLYGELGQTPGEAQLREYVDTLRKRDGKPKISDACVARGAQEACATDFPRIRGERNLSSKVCRIFFRENVPS